MTLRELVTKAINATLYAEECGVSPDDVIVSLQIDGPAGESACSMDVELHYDNNGQASGCVLLGYVEEKS